MNWGKRREELIKMYDNYCMNDFFTKIVTQEQAIVEQLEADKTEILKAFDDLLVEAEGLYMLYPNNFRATTEEYFKHEIELRDKYIKEVK